jgi:hypothetical protein
VMAALDLLADRYGPEDPRTHDQRRARRRTIHRPDRHLAPHQHRRDRRPAGPRTPDLPPTRRAPPPRGGPRPDSPASGRYPQPLPRLQQVSPPLRSRSCDRWTDGGPTSHLNLQPLDVRHHHAKDELGYLPLAGEAGNPNDYRTAPPAGPHPPATPTTSHPPASPSTRRWNSAPATHQPKPSHHPSD